MGVTRRQMMGSAASLAAISVALKNGLTPVKADEPSLFDTSTPFSGDFVQNLAKDLASKPYKEEKVTLPAGRVGILTESAVMAAQIEQLPDLAGYLKIASQPQWRRRSRACR
jgi:glucan biosynthesis protein